ASLAPALLPAAAALGDGAQVSGGLRDAGDPATRYHGGVGRGSPARGVRGRGTAAVFFGASALPQKPPSCAWTHSAAMAGARGRDCDERPGDGMSAEERGRS